MVQLIGAALVGFMVGMIAKLLMPGPDPKGCLVTIALGIGGSLLGTYFGRWLGWYGAEDRAGFWMSLLGAMVVLAIFRALRRPGPM